MVLVEHRSFVVEQVSPEQLRVQVPDFLDPLPHARVLPPQLRSHFVDEGRSHAEHQVTRPVLQDIVPRSHLLLVCRWREHLAPVPRRVV